MLTAFGAFMFAANGNIRFDILIAMLTGLALVIASGCVFNNYIDQGIDARMKRTSKRALVVGSVSEKGALIFGSLLLIVGGSLLGIFTNIPTLLVALFGFFSYVVMYGIWKRKSVHGTEVGSISGAIPPVVGYIAVTGSLDITSGILFILLVLWQMPHFYAIGIFRLREYKAAGLPVLPVVKGTVLAKRYIVFYVLAYTAAIPLLYFFSYASRSYLIAMSVVCAYWLWQGIDNFRKNSDDKWARKMFGVSLIVLLAFSITLSLNAWLP